MNNLDIPYWDSRCYKYINNSVIEKIKKYDKISFENLKYISFIMFGYNCIIIKKMSLHDYEKYGKRKYRFMENLYSEKKK